MLQNGGSLLIFYTRVADQGMYKCIATNILGHDVGKVNLTVREGEISLRLESLGKEGSPHVRESQTIFNLDSGFHAMDSGFQVLDSGWFFVSGTWIPDSLSCIPDSTSKFSQIPEFGFPYWHVTRRWPGIRIRPAHFTMSQIERKLRKRIKIYWRRQ